MNTSLAKTFNYADGAIRTAGTTEEPLFCVKDICAMMGVKNHRDKVRILDTDEKDSVETFDAIGRAQKTTFCTEPGLYRIIFSVQKNDKTRAFKRWVFHDVLPSIRRTGSYTVPQNNLVEQRKLDLEFCKLTKEYFPDCDRMNHLIKEKVASVLQVNGSLAIAQAMPLTVTEVLEQTPGLERTVIHKHRSKFGRLVVGAWRKDRNCEPQKVVKYCNAHSCKVNAYPDDYHETIRTMWLNFLQTM